MWFALSVAAWGQAPPGPCLRPAARSSGRPPAERTAFSQSHPIAVHWNDPDDDGKAAEVLGYAELAWDVQVVQLGFRPPALPDAFDGDELDIYLTDVGHLEAYTVFDTRRDEVEGDGYNGVSTWIAIDEDLPSRWIPTYVAHEFNHALQFNTDFSEWSLPIWEGVAVAAQDWTLGPEEGLWAFDVSSFQEAPFLPTLLADGWVYQDYYLGSTYEYGAALWVMHLDDLVGDGDGAMGPLLWEAAANEGNGLEPDVVDAFAIASGAPLGQALNALARTRVLVGPDWDDRGLPEAQGWDVNRRVPADRVAFADLPLKHRFDPKPMPTGQSFLEIDRPKSLIGDETLVISVTSRQKLQSGLLVLTWDADGGVGELEDWGLDPALELPTAGLARVIVAVTNLETEGWDPDVVNFYSLFDPGDQVLHVGFVDEDPAEPVRGKREQGGGCGCAGAPGAGPWWLAVLGAALWRRQPRADSVAD